MLVAAFSCAGDVVWRGGLRRGGRGGGVLLIWWCVRGEKREWPVHSNRGVVCWCCIHRYGNTVDSLRLKQSLPTSLREVLRAGDHTLFRGCARPRTHHVAPAEGSSGRLIRFWLARHGRSFDLVFCYVDRKELVSVILVTGRGMMGTAF